MGGRLTGTAVATWPGKLKKKLKEIQNRKQGRTKNGGQSAVKSARPVSPLPPQSGQPMTVWPRQSQQGQSLRKKNWVSTRPLFCGAGGKRRWGAGRLSRALARCLPSAALGCPTAAGWHARRRPHPAAAKLRPPPTHLHHQVALILEQLLGLLCRIHAAAAALVAGGTAAAAAPLTHGCRAVGRGGRRARRPIAGSSGRALAASEVPHPAPTHSLRERLGQDPPPPAFCAPGTRAAPAHTGAAPPPSRKTAALPLAATARPPARLLPPGAAQGGRSRGCLGGGGRREWRRRQRRWTGSRLHVLEPLPAQSPPAAWPAEAPGLLLAASPAGRASGGISRRSQACCGRLTEPQAMCERGRRLNWWQSPCIRHHDMQRMHKRAPLCTCNHHHLN